MKKMISDLPDDRFTGRPVLVRMDFNVPISKGKIREDYRLRRAIPTIEYLCQRGAKVILASHLGKPKGTLVPELSLKPVADRLREMLKVSAMKFVEGEGSNVFHVVRDQVEMPLPAELSDIAPLRLLRRSSVGAEGDGEVRSHVARSIPGT